MNTPELTLEKSLSIVLDKLHHIPNFKDYQEAKNIVLTVQEGLRDLSLARLQIESQGVTEGKSEGHSTALPASSDASDSDAPRRVQWCECGKCHDVHPHSNRTSAIKDWTTRCPKCGYSGYVKATDPAPPIHTEESPSDKEMLDWLDQGDHALVRENGTYRVFTGNYMSTRSAIKAAMEQEK